GMATERVNMEAAHNVSNKPVAKARRTLKSRGAKRVTDFFDIEAVDENGECDTDEAEGDDDDPDFIHDDEVMDWDVAPNPLTMGFDRSSSPVEGKLGDTVSNIDSKGSFSDVSDDDETPATRRDGIKFVESARNGEHCMNGDPAEAGIHLNNTELSGFRSVELSGEDSDSDESHSLNITQGGRLHCRAISKSKKRAQAAMQSINVRRKAAIERTQQVRRRNQQQRQNELSLSIKRKSACNSRVKRHRDGERIATKAATTKAKKLAKKAENYRANRNNRSPQDIDLTNFHKSLDAMQSLNACSCCGQYKPQPAEGDKKLRTLSSDDCMFSLVGSAIICQRTAVNKSAGGYADTPGANPRIHVNHDYAVPPWRIFIIIILLCTSEFYSRLLHVRLFSTNKAPRSCEVELLRAATSKQ
ncbi:hypothetical protein N9P82_01370, partial [bacterium]|nr:hypothetical protein [bacterium]